MGVIADRIARFARGERERFEGLTAVQRTSIILRYLANVGITKPANWCASWVSTVVALAIPGGAPKSAGARQWGRKALALGWQDVAAMTPHPGDVWIWWRDSHASWKGHIGIVIQVDGEEVTTLEGNVKGQARGERVIGYRKYDLSGAVLPKNGQPTVPSRRIMALRVPD